MLACLSCGDDEPSSVWDDLQGTIYAFDMYPGPLFAVDAVSGEKALVTDLPDAIGSVIASPVEPFLVYGDGDLVRFDLEARTNTPLVVDPFSKIQPGLSASGTMLSYRSSEPAGYVIKRRRLETSDDLVLLGPEPDLSFVSAGWSGDSLLVFFDAYSAPPWRLRGLPTDGGPSGLVGGDTGFVARQATMAPDGRRVALVNRGHTGSTDVEVVVLDLSGVSQGPAVALPVVVGPMAWSPDGRYLVLSSRIDTPTLDLVLLHVATGSIRVLRNDDGNESDPAWSNYQETTK